MLHARSIIKDYGNFRALDGVDFDIEEPGIFGIIGHNGAGKTTLLKIMSGLIPATSGELTINGVDVMKNPDGLKEQMGYLPEESRLYENMTAHAYLTFFGEIYSMKPDGIDSRIKELFRKLSLEVGDKKLGELSKGMKRKVAIARSLLHDPSSRQFCRDRVRSRRDIAYDHAARCGCDTLIDAVKVDVCSAG